MAILSAVTNRDTKQLIDLRQYAVDEDQSAFKRLKQYFLLNFFDLARTF